MEKLINATTDYESKGANGESKDGKSKGADGKSRKAFSETT